MTIGPEHWQGCLDRWQVTGRLPGVVAGVVRDGELAWAGGAGEVVGDPAGSQLRIGSITKTFVAVAVLQLRDEGRLALGDSLGVHVGDAPYAEATVRELLSHTSGMQSEPSGSWWERAPGGTLEELWAAHDGSGRVAGRGEYFHYSNLGFALLGELVARLRGEPWWDVVQRRILDPLTLTRTTYDAVAPHAQGYSVDHFRGTLTREPHQDTRAMAPAGQAWSTVTDLARWAGFLAAGHPDVLSAETLREMAEPVPPAPDYGLGLRLVEGAGRTFVGHTGSMPGFLASCFVTSDGDGWVLLSNATTGLATMGHPLELFEAAPAGDATGSWVPTEEVPAPANEIVGVWFWGNTALELRWNNGFLEQHSLAVPGLMELFALDDGRLVGIDGYHRGETLHVVRRPDGSVGHLEVATWVYTRTPYDPAAPIPGGHPA